MSLVRTAHQIDSAETWHRLRADDVTASGLGSVLGVGFETPLGYWQRKRDRERVDLSSASINMGRWLERSAMEAFTEKTGLSVEHNTTRAGIPRRYYRIRSDVTPHLRAGVTPDSIVVDRHGGQLAVAEGKACSESVYRDMWDGGATPPGYVLQVKLQLIALGLTTGYLSLLVVLKRGGCEHHLRKIELTPGDTRGICSCVIRFWRSIEEGNMPSPTYGRDSSVLGKLTRPDGGSIMDDPDQIIDLCDAYDRHRAHEKAAGAAKDYAGDMLRESMLEYETARPHGFTVSYTPDKRGRRSLRVTRRSK